jgi:hypothetical protein
VSSATSDICRMWTEVVDDHKMRMVEVDDARW